MGQFAGIVKTSQLGGQAQCSLPPSYPLSSPGCCLSGSWGSCSCLAERELLLEQWPPCPPPDLPSCCWCGVSTASRTAAKHFIKYFALKLAACAKSDTIKGENFPPCYLKLNLFDNSSLYFQSKINLLLEEEPFLQGLTCII